MHHSCFRFMGIVAALLLASCGGPSSSPVDPSSPALSSDSAQTSAVTPSASVDPEVVIEPTNEVTKTTVHTYAGPTLMESSKNVSVKVAGEELFVYETLVNHGRVFSWVPPTTKAAAAIFDFEGKVNVEVEIAAPASPIVSATLRPLAYSIPVAVMGNKLSFELTHPGNYVLEYNDDPTTAVHIFANALETDLPDRNDPKLIYVGPGIYDAGAFPIEDGTKIYLAGGSYVYGQFSAEGAKDVKIFGRGIVSGSIYSRASSNEYKIPVVMREVKNLVIQDVAFFDPAGWALHIWKCQNVKIHNVKIITARSNGDGISLQSCSDVEVSGGFVRSWDDSLVVKNSDLGSTANIHIHDVTVWNDLAQCMEVGYETYGPTMDNIVFEDITVVHAFHKAVISMHNCDQAVITNVHYKNITVEDCQTLGDDRGDGENDFLVDFTIAYNQEWTKSGGKRGSISGVEVSDVNVLKIADTVQCRILGDEEGTDVSDVTFSGINLVGKQAKNAADLKLFTNDHVKNVSVRELPSAKGAHIHLPYKLNLSTATMERLHEEAVPQEGMLVPEFAFYRGEEPFIGVKGKTQGTASATHGAGAKTSTPADDGTGPFFEEGHPAELAFDGDPATLYRCGAWKDEENEFAALTFDFDGVLNVGVLRIKGNAENRYSYSYAIQVWARRYKTDGTMNPNYTRLLTTKSYAMSPASGNLIDINLPTQDFGGLQLRLVRTEGLSAPERYEIGEIEFYPPSLTFGKAVVDASEHNDVYPVGKVVDGDPTGTSYYESKSLPCHIVIDLGDAYKLSKIVFCLPPILTWSARTQNIEVLSSDSPLAYDASSTPFMVALPAKDYLFDPLQGNRVVLDLDEVPTRYLKVMISSNSAYGGYGGQLSEISAYGTK
ncbi:MAG: hypothetical protein IJS52_02355 [Bacilli bacterium]|nr:hypothetical protein [Bacilli bacterium]